MKSISIVKSLPVVFTKDELLQLAKSSMELSLQIDEIENQKTKLNGLYAEVISISKKMKQGYEERQVSCEVKYNTPHNGKKTIVRSDTGEAVSIENMTNEEFQEELDLKGTEIIQDVKQISEGQKSLSEYKDVK